MSDGHKERRGQLQADIAGIDVVGGLEPDLVFAGEGEEVADEDGLVGEYGKDCSCLHIPYLVGDDVTGISCNLSFRKIIS